MALTLATGVELGAADSYVSLTAVDDYFDALQDTNWTSTVDDGKKEWLLKRSSTLINQRYLWNVPTTPYVAVPRALEIATFELAKHWLVTSATQGVAESSPLKKVGVGAITVEFADSGASGAPEQIYSFIDGLLVRLGTPRAITSPVASTGSTGWGSIAITRA